MGACLAVQPPSASLPRCCDGTTDSSQEIVPPSGRFLPLSRIRPLLADLQNDFRLYAGDDNMLDATELADVWEACARRRAHITTEDVKTIRETAQMYLRIIDMNGNGLIDYQEFFVFMLGGMEERGPLKNMRDRLARNPAKTQEIIQRFLKWDVDGDGFVTRSELAAHLGEIEELSGTLGVPEFPSHPRKTQNVAYA